MDLNRCRTCFSDLNNGDLYQKLNVIHRNSTLSLAEKLKMCMPSMDLKNPDSLFICMQCSMQLETAFTFHMTCLKTEEEFRKYAQQALNSVKYMELPVKARKNNSTEEKQKSIGMSCSNCNISFSTKSIFDLHMKIMHSKTETTDEEDLETLKDRKFLNKTELDDDMPHFEMMAVLQTTIQKKQKVDVRKSKKKMKNNVKVKRKYITSAEKLEELRERCRKLARNPDGTFKKNEKRVQQNVIDNYVTTNQNSTLNQTKTPVSSKTNSKNDKIPKKKSLFTCKFCPKKFNAHGQLSRHLVTMHKDKCHRCNLCNKYYTNTKEHKKKCGYQLQSSTGNDQTLPKNISYRFSEDRKLCYIDSSDKLPMCVICRQKCENESELKKHISEKHKVHLKCKTCSKSYTPTGYCSHVGKGCPKDKNAPYFSYTSDGECICPLCNKIFKNIFQFTGHLAVHKRDKLVCRTCNKEFFKIKPFGQHIMRGCDKGRLKVEKTDKVFVKMEYNDSIIDECNVQESDPIASDDNRTDNFLDKAVSKNVKVEATELLHQNAFTMSEDWNSIDNSVVSDLNEPYISINEDSDLNEPYISTNEDSDLNEQYISINDDSNLNEPYININEDDMIDTPQLIYILPQNSPTN